MAEAIAARIGWAFEHLRGVTWPDGEPRTYEEILDAIENAASAS